MKNRAVWVFVWLLVQFSSQMYLRGLERGVASGWTSWTMSRGSRGSWGPLTKMNPLVWGPLTLTSLKASPPPTPPPPPTRWSCYLCGGRSSILGPMGLRIDSSWWTICATPRSSRFFTTGVAKAVVCAILFMGFCI